MPNLYKKLLRFLVIVALVVLVSSKFIKTGIYAETSEPTFVLYFTGVGCPHCAKVDPVIFKEWINDYPNLVVVEYEIYQQSQNAILIDEYDSNYNSGYYIPLIIINHQKQLLGDKTIIADFDKEIQNNKGNKLPLIDGTEGNLKSLNSLPFNPKVWSKDRIAIKTDPNTNLEGEVVQDFISGKDVEEILDQSSAQLIEAQEVQLSGSTVTFENAVQIKGWILQWNGPSVQGITSGEDASAENGNSDSSLDQREVSFGKTISLALVDAVNPCAFAVLTMMLVAIISYNPKDKKNIILAGLAFSLSVFVMYMFYGLVIIRFFKIVQAITNIRLILYKVLGVIAIILGLLQIKDFITYKPGGIGTEMPLALRPKVKKIIEGITSPKGAFGVGTFVTIFLLPCTIGPYVILGGMLSFSETLKSIPHLLLYNLIFILPMLLITCIVYLGISRVEDISSWKDKNIRIMHLIAGLIIAILGMAMLLGLL